MNILIKNNQVFKIYFYCIVCFISTGVVARERIISLVPSTTDIIFKLGIAESLIGVSDYCSTDKVLCSKPRLGTAIKINWEKLLLLKPTIVFIDSYTKKNDLNNFKKLKINYVSFPHNLLKEIQQSILLVGKSLDRDIVANKILSSFKKELQRFKNILKFKKVLIVISEKLYKGKITSALVVGTNNFYSDLINLLGANNVSKVSGYRNMDVETLMSYKPDIVYSIKFSNIKNKKVVLGWNHLYKNSIVKVLVGRSGIVPSLNLISFLEKMVK